MSQQIYELLPKVAADIGPVAKARKNQQQNYQFRGIEDVMNAANPVLAKHGVTAIPRVLEMTRDKIASKSGGSLNFTLLKVEYLFCAPDGSSVNAIVVGEGMDAGDKSSNKAMSQAFKYALGQVLSIPFEATDSENDHYETDHSQQQPQKQRQANGTPPQGNGSAGGKPGATVSSKQAQELAQLCGKTGIPLSVLCEKYRVNAVTEIPVEKYHVARAGMQKMIADGLRWTPTGAVKASEAQGGDDGSPDQDPEDDGVEV